MGFLYLSYWVAPFAYVRITAVRRERLDDITDDDARKEGYPSVEAYREAFERIYGFWDTDAEAWCWSSSWV
ncbi:ASCH domain-containing protein [Candidatus Desulforudis audaxviator]|uniref:ASCH domain-containing protein n=1 Tax=Candidatus Desulforudis audaxviator TaxID=471827 RepID=UPI002FDC87CA